MDPQPAAVAGVAGPDDLHLQPPHVGDGADRRPGHRRRAGPVDRRRDDRRRSPTGASSGSRCVRRGPTISRARSARPARRPSPRRARSRCGGSTAAQIGDLALSSASPIYGLTEHRSSLEEVYFDLTETASSSMACSLGTETAPLLHRSSGAGEHPLAFGGSGSVDARRSHRVRVDQAAIGAIGGVVPRADRRVHDRYRLVAVLHLDQPSPARACGTCSPSTRRLSRSAAWCWRCSRSACSG